MKRWRIMVVDDEEDVRHLIAATLKDKYEVVEAQDGLDSLEKLERYEPDFIIMDVMMPLMNGLDASIAIRENPQFNYIPILFLSALSTREDMQKAYRSGADLYLTKPFDPPRLLNAIASFLKKSSYPPHPKKYTLEQIQQMEEGKIPVPAAPEVPAVPPPKPPSEFERIAERQPQPRRRPSPYRKYISRAQPRVMVVDDEQDMLDFLRITLQQHFEVVTASDGIAAIRKLVIYQPDVFMLDIMLPKMSGYQLCQSLRRNKTYKDSPIVIISAKSSRKDQAYALRIGADAFLAKPFNANDVLNLLSRVIEKRRVIVKAKQLSLDDIEKRESEEKRIFAEKDERILKRQEESEIQKLLRREVSREEKN